MSGVAQWLAETQIDRLPLECDGLTRVISTLMSRDGIEHAIHIGSLSIDEVGTIPLHWWISLADGSVCDFRARMWLGASDAVPHGVFSPQEQYGYSAREIQRSADIALHPVVFAILAERDMGAFPVYRSELEPVSDNGPGL